MQMRDGGETALVAVGTCVVGAGTAVGAGQTSNAGPILAFVGAITVALITWYATDKRQSKALEAERERLQDRLLDERRRHDDTLRHEERHQFIEEFRRVLD